MDTCIRKVVLSRDKAVEETGKKDGKKIMIMKIYDDDDDDDGFAIGLNSIKSNIVARMHSNCDTMMVREEH